MGRYLIDNNVISNYFSASFSDIGMAFLSDVINDRPNLSVITEIEALSWVSADKRKEKIVRDFIIESNIHTITPSIAERCIAIRRSRRMKTPDAIIAATAIVHEYILITSDVDFTNVKDLQILDPFSL